MSKKHFRLIPTVLFKNGSVVKSENFTNHRIVGDLPSTLRVFSRRQADELFIFDLSASANSQLDWTMIETCVTNSNMPLTYGGGIKSVDDATKLIQKGFDKICVNSLLFDSPKTVTQIAHKIGSSSTLASIDIRTYKDELYTTSKCGQCLINKLDIHGINTHLESVGVGEILLNLIDNDGLMKGYSIEILKQFVSVTKMPVIISGGCGGYEDIIAAYNVGCDAAAMASIFLWKGDSIPSLKAELQQFVPVRSVIN